MYEMTAGTACVKLLDLNSIDQSMFNRYGIFNTKGITQLGMNILYNASTVTNMNSCSLRYLTEDTKYKGSVMLSNENCFL